MKIIRTEHTGKLRSNYEWIYGVNSVIEAIKAKRKIKRIFISSSRRKKVVAIIKYAEVNKIPLTITSPIFFDHNFNKGHQGVAARVYSKSYYSLDKLLKIPYQKNEDPLFLVLDCVEDPRNFGAILRVADAAGFHGVIIQSHRSVKLGPEVSKVSAGAVEHVPVCVVPNIKHPINEMRKDGIVIIGAEAETRQILWDTDFRRPVTIVVGSEGKGLRKTIKSICDIIIKIPMQGKINSLNVSVATGVIAFEILRQRIKK